MGFCCSIFCCELRKRRRDPCCLSVITWFIHPRLQAADSPLRPDVGPSVPFAPQLGPVSSASVWSLLQFKLLAVVSSPAPPGATVLVIGTMSCSCQTGTRNFLPNFLDWWCGWDEKRKKATVGNEIPPTFDSHNIRPCSRVNAMALSAVCCRHFLAIVWSAAWIQWWLCRRHRVISLFKMNLEILNWNDSIESRMYLFLFCGAVSNMVEDWRLWLLELILAPLYETIYRIQLCTHSLCSVGNR